MREISINTAIEEWKFAREFAATHGAKLPPIDVYIMHMVMLSEFLGKNALSGGSVAQFMRDLGSLTDESIGAAEAVMQQREQKFKAKLMSLGRVRLRGRGGRHELSRQGPEHPACLLSPFGGAGPVRKVQDFRPPNETDAIGLRLGFEDYNQTDAVAMSAHAALPVRLRTGFLANLGHLADYGLRKNQVRRVSEARKRLL